MTQAQHKTCQNCKQEFVIEPDDLSFYEGMGVPKPKWCPDCRFMRRLAHRNERTFFKRQCDATNKSIIAIYPEDVPFPVYEQKHWESGDWDALKYGREFDFSRPFFEQFKELRDSVPRPNLRDFESVNSSYCNQCERNKDAYLLVSSSHNHNAMYSTWLQSSEDAADNLYAYDVHRTYEIVGAARGRNLFWSQDIENCYDCWFCFDLKGSNNCFLSYNLRNKSYYWENQPLSKEEWLGRFSKMNTGSFEEVQKLKERWLNMVRQEAVHKFADHHTVSDVSGDYFFQSKNIHKSFDVSFSEHCKYCQYVMDAKDSWDNTETAFKIDRTYELHGSAVVARSLFANICWESHDLYYCDLCHYSSDLFGCVGLKHKKYCILNRQYEKNEYAELKKRIITHMKETGEWGEFFPVSMSVFSYNESVAQAHFPMEKQDILTRGWRWNDALPGTFGQETVKTENLPDDITATSESILNEILACSNCGKNYRVIKQELDFYKALKLPLPRLCPNCRYRARMAMRRPRKLWPRNCMCVNNSSHFHNKEHCPNNFLTSFAPERPEIVYCEQCYNAEVV